MTPYLLTEPATDENFDEEAYLSANPDVARVLKEGISLLSGRQHFDLFGKAEGRCIRLPFSVISAPKIKKLEKIKHLLRNDMSFVGRNGHLFDFLNDELRSLYNIVNTDAVSSNSYDRDVLEIIEKNKKGLILDCGAGRRDEYYENVVNFEIVDYDTTDVLGVGEKLPFIDNVFDAVFSLSVLEHVKNPFTSAKEIARVLKPGGSLICSVPFLQPFHGYPHHYYNMTGQGLSNLFDEMLYVDKIEVNERAVPIWSLTWFLRNWVNGLKGETKENFLQMKVADLIETAEKYLDMPFVKELPHEKNLELAYATVLFAHK